MRESIQFAVWHAAARAAGWLRPRAARAPAPKATGNAPAGISVVIPSRNGQALLAAQLAGIVRELTMAWEIIVVDNGSTDGTAQWLAKEWPAVKVEVCPEALSFAAAVNRGIRQARYSHICLLNNDMLLYPRFFTALLQAFELVPALFCATAQIRFPVGVRREETGKAVMTREPGDDFPLRCLEPIAGEDLTWVLYGSGGCSLYDAAMLRALGGMDEAYAPAYVEDLDVGYRAWQRGWPTVFVAGALVEHRHRATTSRYYTEAQLAEVLETNYLKFLARAVSGRALFHALWREATGRLRRRRDSVLRHAGRIALAGSQGEPGAYREERILSLTCGDVAVFPGKDAAGAPLVTFAEELATPADALLARHCEVVLVRSGKPMAMEAAQEWTEKKWSGETNGQAGRLRGNPASPGKPRLRE